MRLALDHLTVVDARPERLVKLAAKAGAQGCCLFLEGMAVLANMPSYSLIDDLAALRETRKQLIDNAITLDLVYPFTLSSRSKAESFAPALEAAAELGAKAINLLVYDRDPARQIEQVAQVCERAGHHGLKAVVEFFPRSAIAGLDQAVELVGAVGATNLGINVDILHLYRSNSADLAKLVRHRELIGYAQLADGPLLAPEDRDHEAGNQRQLPGLGELDIRAFVAAIGPAVGISVEVPDEVALRAGLTDEDRALAALNAARQILS